MLIKLLMVLGVAVIAGYIATRLMPRLRQWVRALGRFLGQLTRNPLLKTLLISGVMRLIRLLVFRRF